MVMRLSGLASGMDIDQMVSDLMRAHRMQVNKSYQQKQVLEWRREDYRTINTKLLTLRNSAFDMKLQGTYMAKKATSSNNDILTATAGNTALAGDYSVTVHNLATGVTKSSTEALAASYTEGENGQVIKTLGEQFGLSGDITFILQGNVNGEVKEKTFTFNAANHNIYQVAGEINNAGLGIKASYDSNLERFFLMTSGTGEQAEIHVKADEQNFLTENLKLNVNVGADEANAHRGTDAVIDFNDATGLKFSSNQFTVNGITFNLMEGSGKTVKVSVNQDVDAVMEKIKAFVETYNSTIDSIAGKLNEDRNRDFPPLTDDQKKDMKDRDIEKWEEKARSGMLKADGLLGSAYNEIRANTAAVVEGLSGKYTSLSSIGITTKNWYDNGKLEINETKLREALTNDPEGVMNLFTVSNEDSKKSGVATKLYDAVVNTMSQITTKAGSNAALYDDSILGENIRRVDETISKAEERLANLEERYYRQFTAMEQAINQMNSQSMWLMQQFSSNQG
ncbi:MAG: flagellar filament capping protein FliD [Syntrophomonadales bacterium]